MPAIFLPRAMRIGAGALDELPAALSHLGLRAPAILTDAFLAGSGAIDRLVYALAAAGIEARSYSEVIPDATVASVDGAGSDEHTSELQSLMRTTYAVFWL